MDAETAGRIKNDFRDWSGGFAPESRHQISVYVDFAMQRGDDCFAVTAILINWMRSTNPDDDLLESWPMTR